MLDACGLAVGQIISVQAHGASQLRNAADPYAAENRRLSVLVLHAAPEPTAADQPDAPKPAAAPPAAAPPAAAPKPAAVPQPAAPPAP